MSEKRNSSTAGRRNRDMPITKLVQQMEALNALNKDQSALLNTIKSDIHAMHEIITAWNNAKGFLSVGKWLLQGLILIGGAVAAFKGFNWIRGA